MAKSKGVTATETRLLDEGVSQGFLESQRNSEGTAKGINFDPQDYQSTLSAWNSSDSFTGGTKGGQGGLEGIWDTLRADTGIEALESTVVASKASLQEAEQAGRATQQALRDRPESINLIRGRQQQASLMASQEQLALAEQANLAIDELNMANRELETRFGFRAQEYQTLQSVMLSNPQAGININDSISVATSKLGKYQEQQADDIEKQGLKDLAMQLGISTKGSSKDLRKRISKNNKKALANQQILIDQQIQSGQMSLDKAMASLNAVTNTTNVVGVSGEPTWETNYFNPEQAVIDPQAGTQTNTTNAVQSYLGSNYPIK